MNAHQRRIDRRSRSCVIFDLEAIPTQWGDITKVVILGSDPRYALDLFYMPTRTERDARSHTVKLLKAREAQHNEFYVALLSDMDFTNLEERIAAVHPAFVHPFAAPLNMDSV